jgi:hypothetical protein
MFWCWGHQKLVAAGEDAKRRASVGTRSSEADVGSPTETAQEATQNTATSAPNPETETCDPSSLVSSRVKAKLNEVFDGFKQTVISPGFIALVLGLITALIPPLQAALFSSGGALRFLGSAIESLASASAPLGTMIVAASLNIPTAAENASANTRETGAVLQQGLNNIPVQNDTKSDELQEESEHSYNVEAQVPNNNTFSEDKPSVGANHVDSKEGDCVIADTSKLHDWLPSSSEECPTKPHGSDSLINAIEAESNTHRRARPSAIMSDPFYGPRRRRSSFLHLSKTVSRRSVLAIKAVRGPTFALHAWFIASRLILAPALICAMLIGLDCWGVLSEMSGLAKLVILLNAALPGALIVVVVLKSRELTDTAALVAKVYLPSYLLCVLTITGWTSVGLIISIPDAESNSICRA